MTRHSTHLSKRTGTINDVDLKLLRVFAEIVRCNGFSAAQASLGMTQATISLHMRNLEERLNIRLCERGRSGFYLTNEGKQIYSAMLDLFGSLERFRGAVGDVQGELTGRLAFGTVDAMITNSNLNLNVALGSFARQAPKVQLDIDIAAPQELSQGIMSGRYQIVLMPAQPFLPQSHVIDVFLETQYLYCGQDHPLYAIPDAELTPERLAQQSFAGRSYMTQTTICGVDFSWGAVTAHMEGTLLLLLSGAYVGFLPDHYGAQLVRSGKLRILAPGRMNFKDRFQIVHSRDRPTLAATLLTDAITDAIHTG